MYISYNELFTLIKETISQDAQINVIGEMMIPPPDYSLTGTTFGSAQHMIRRQSPTIRGKLTIEYTFTWNEDALQLNNVLEEKDD